MDQLLWFLFAGTRGGPNRLRIVELIHDRPYNAHQIAEPTRLDYRTVCHHLDVLVRHHVLVSPNRETYGALYFLSGLTSAEWSTVVRIKSRLLPSGDHRASAGGDAAPTDPNGRRQGGRG